MDIKEIEDIVENEVSDNEKMEETDCIEGIEKAENIEKNELEEEVEITAETATEQLTHTYMNFNDNMKLYNVALFIDYENVYKNLLKIETNAIRDGFFEKIRKWCQDRNRRLVKIAVYCNYDNEDLHESFHQSLLQSYGVETIHTSNQGKNYADLQITIDVLNAMHINDNIDEFLIMSNDKDMTPLLNNIRYNKKKVSIITTGDIYNQTICSFADEQIKYEDIVKEIVGETIIDSIQNKIYVNLDNFVNKNYNKHIDSGDKYRHIELEYYARSLLTTYNLMSYEIYNCLMQLYNMNKIFTYEYTYNKNTHWGIVSDTYKNVMISEGILTMNDIKVFDFQGKISELYHKFSSD